MPSVQESKKKSSKKVGEFICGPMINGGSHGSVRRGVDSRNNRPVAVKSCPLDGANKVSSHVVREVNALRVVKHPNIVELVDVLVSKSSAYVILSLSEGQDLQQIIAQEGRMDEKEASRVFKGVVQAIAHCHDKGVSHRDIKPENVLVNRNKRETLLCDFGFAHNQVEDKETGLKNPTSTTCCGTLGYVAPEIYRSHGTGKPYNTCQADMYSLGVLLFTMLCGKMPYKTPATWDDGEDMVTQGLLRPKSLPSHLSHEAITLLRSLLKEVPTSRPTARQVLTHSFFSEPAETTDASVLTRRPSSAASSGSEWTVGSMSSLNNTLVQSASRSPNGSFLPPIRSKVNNSPLALDSRITFGTR